jgi:hypothetical protein
MKKDTLETGVWSPKAMLSTVVEYVKASDALVETMRVTESELGPVLQAYLNLLDELDQIDTAQVRYPNSPDYLHKQNASNYWISFEGTTEVEITFTTVVFGGNEYEDEEIQVNLPIGFIKNPIQYSDEEREKTRLFLL